MKTQFLRNWPRESILRKLSPTLQTILIYDRVLAPEVETHFWFIENRIAVDGGEQAKTLESFAALAKDILPRVSGFSPNEIELIGLGGGSIGDLVGFMASVLKRGVNLSHIPSTYLSAIDSAYGGKTALNMGEFKNQIGTFYEAKSVLCLKPLLDSQPEVNLRSGYGELIKMALLSGGEIYRQLAAAEHFDRELMWHLLPLAVEAKKKIVARDPLENKGIRHLLNLGHTLGHAFELEQQLPHGLAVQHGLDFCLDFSRKLGLMKDGDYEKSKAILAKNIAGDRARITSEKLDMLLRQDKKITKNSRMRFVLLKKPGRPVIREINVEQIVEAAIDMDWAQ